jgi:hypothetical protein
MIKIINQTKVIFFDGEKFIFKYIGNGEWECISNNPVIWDGAIESLEGLIS